VIRETPAPQDRKVRPDLLVQPVPQAHKARRVKLVLRDQQAQLARPVHKDLRVKLVRKDPQVPQVQRVLKARKV